MTSTQQQRSYKLMDVWSIKPSPENDKLYGPVDPTDGSIIALANSIREFGLREPIVITQDWFILSGHRRYAACKLAGLKVVRVRIKQIRRSDDIDAFVVLLREFNRQRVKSIDVQLREAVIDVNPLEARAELIEYRREKAKVGYDPLLMGECKIRRAISDAKILSPTRRFQRGCASDQMKSRRLQMAGK